jgi:hypothetical protein
MINYGCDLPFVKAGEHAEVINRSPFSFRAAENLKQSRNSIVWKRLRPTNSDGFRSVGSKIDTQNIHFISGC